MTLLRLQQTHCTLSLNRAAQEAISHRFLMVEESRREYHRFLMVEESRREYHPFLMVEESRREYHRFLVVEESRREYHRFLVVEESRREDLRTQEEVTKFHLRLFCPVV